MNRYQNIQFFDKDGNPLNFNYDDEAQKWVGSMYYPKVSVDLYEVIQLFILEKFIKDDKTIFGKPHIHDSSGEPTIKAYWKSDENTEIFLFQFDIDATEPTINIIDELSITLDKDTNEVLNTGNVIKVTDIVNEEAIQIDTALQSDSEYIYDRTLILLDTNDGLPIAEIYFYGETVGVDERLNVLTSNMNYRVFNKDSDIFKDADIDEELPDHILLNRKKKEVLLEGHNIFPYKGTYKGLINAIKFFGYDDLVLKEYWKNVNINSSKYGTYRHSQVLDIFDTQVDLNDKSLELPNINYRKTGKFGLFYKINEIKEGYFDSYDLPIVEENVEYTVEEALIKLYGLKSRLKKDFLPGKSRIVDIIGEADYFDKKQITASVLSNKTDEIENGIDVDFNIYPSQNGYIEDLRTIEELINPSFTPRNIDHDIRMNNTEYLVEDITDVLLAYFTTYYPNIKDIHQLPDKENIPAGYLVVLENNSFNSTWDDAGVAWDSLGTDSDHIYDFIPLNFYVGDNFRIIDDFSGEYIEYTTQIGDTQEDVVDALIVEWNILYQSADLPWSNFLPTKITSTEGFTLRSKGLGVATTPVQYIWRTETIHSGIDTENLKMRKFSTSNLYTWDSFGRGNFYDIEWIVKKSADDTGIPFNYTIRDDVADLDKLVINLPYTGMYDVQLILHDTMNQISSTVKREYITVESREIEFSGYYRFKEKEYLWWNNDNTWDRYGSTWDLPTYKTATYDEINLSWDAFNRSNMLPNRNVSSSQDIQTYRNDGSTNYVGPYFWDNMTALWDDAYHIWWDSSAISGNTPANFIITSVFYAHSLIIETKDDISSHTFKVYDLDGAATELNDSEDSIISKYIYNIVKDENGLDQFIQAVAKVYGKTGDFIDVTGSSSKINISHKENSKSNNPTFNDVRIINEGVELPPLVHCSFSYDQGKMPGKTKPNWSIENNSNTDFTTIYSDDKYLNYLFIEKGNYTITLSLQDSNGNRITKERNLILVN